MILNVAGWLIAYFTQHTTIGAAFAVFYSEVSQWTGFVAQGLFWLGWNSWLTSVIVWALPFLFVPFEKKRPSDRTQKRLSRVSGTGVFY